MAEDWHDMDDAAIDWIVRLRDPGFDGWEAFGAWLAADPAHAEAYHRLALADQDMGDLVKAVPAPVVAPVVGLPPVRRTITRRTWLGGAIAASVAGLIGFGVIERQPAFYPVETAPGVRRTVTLEDGSRIALNGGTRVLLDRKDARFATLERGEALFDVVHDDDAPFKVAVGDATLVDVGTRFNVLREGKVTAVQVAEGAVIYNPDNEAVRLDAGQALRALDGDAHLQLAAVSPAAVAGWREGRLIYDGQPMTEIAADLARWSGQPVRADPRLAERRFRGVLSLGDGDDIVRLAPLLDVDVRRDGGTWILAPRTQ
ncbi:FecR family protein [Rhizorhabdus dicambivorans]|uniref:Iron dicitrate transport regulator FecR n=1 Tax=Rhizorhabdus dicambivorans TaxID=1850238 RepID=A0A2A4FRJ4_9SPHN|nr:FecR domain-containing protein [Rhizorhabdus dicambivorans]ATE66475.1 iron dicitrate transport regulator FecR [Rhizorhabdus dicambivorans]PCE41033.1 iron dicitrate transport regulator FecR [Rhizorhabdus dicambivorans]